MSDKDTSPVDGDGVSGFELDLWRLGSRDAEDAADAVGSDAEAQQAVICVWLVILNRQNRQNRQASKLYEMSMVRHR